MHQCPSCRPRTPSSPVTSVDWRGCMVCVRRVRCGMEMQTSVIGVPRRQDLTTRGYPESVTQDLSPAHHVVRVSSRLIQHCLLSRGVRLYCPTLTAKVGANQDLVSRSVSDACLGGVEYCKPAVLPISVAMGSKVSLGPPLTGAGTHRRVDPLLRGEVELATDVGVRSSGRHLDDCSVPHPACDASVSDIPW